MATDDTAGAWIACFVAILIDAIGGLPKSNIQHFCNRLLKKISKKTLISEEAAEDLKEHFEYKHQAAQSSSTHAFTDSNSAEGRHRGFVSI